MESNNANEQLTHKINDKKKKNDVNNKKGKSEILSVGLILILLALFTFTFIISVFYYNKYMAMNELGNNEEVIEIKRQNIKASILNNGKIDETINKNMFTETKREIIVTNIDELVISSIDKKEDVELVYDVKYKISKNDFFQNSKPSTNSEVLVKFSYSYDQEEWHYINNAISTSTSNISSILNNGFDIAGLVTDLSVATDYKLSTKNNEEARVYWRSETIFRKTNHTTDDKKLEANFVIEYNN